MLVGVVQRAQCGDCDLPCDGALPSFGSVCARMGPRVAFETTAFVMLETCESRFCVGSGPLRASYFAPTPNKKKHKKRGSRQIGQNAPFFCQCAFG